MLKSFTQTVDKLREFYQKKLIGYAINNCRFARPNL